MTGNFPWLARVMQYLLKKSKFQVAFSQLEDLTLQIIEQRRNENLPGKVRYSQDNYSGYTILEKLQDFVLVHHYHCLMATCYS